MTNNQKLSFLLRATIAIIYLQTLYFKFTGHPDSMHIFSALGLEPYGRVATGVMELVTSILLFIPRYKLLAIFTSLGLISGAIVSHLIVLGIFTNGDCGTLFSLALIVLACTIALIVLYRKEYSSFYFKYFFSLKFLQKHKA
jgi:putative oxidoreductase